ncbi:hypothetical protein [Amycolatopsis sp. EV170708-02-1]|uniref:hypothetical protein n=1 Tax=Amycolatopsis sp. EV170708-02-1 TaxID=2919322 RepID=UPI001F0CCF46|nr:hypothetical protein [Amycolatopsis sp. EV170708-02-1]UMP06947.1 hypothetical protein MJQ72_19975 [Amycolatopsis sp. EV170708-02-1]
MSLVEVAELSVQAVRSHVFSAYIHAAALFTYPTSWDPVKYHAAELTRLEPKKLRRALPDQSQEFLRLFSEKICRLAITRVTERLPDRVAHAESQSVTTTEEVLRDSDDKTRLYWEATLTDQHDHRDVMKYCFDRMTVLDDFDVVDGMPLVVKEVRAHGDRKYPTYTEMARAQDQIADAATHAYVVAKRLHNPTPEMLADFEAALQELRAHGARLGPGGGGTQ